MIGKDKGSLDSTQCFDTVSFYSFWNRDGGQWNDNFMWKL